MINWESIDFGEFEKAQSQNSSERRARHYFCPVSWPSDDKLACILFANKDMYTAHSSSSTSSVKYSKQIPFIYHNKPLQGKSYLYLTNIIGILTMVKFATDCLSKRTYKRHPMQSMSMLHNENQQ